jgi:hypothetical protein
MFKLYGEGKVCSRLGMTNVSWPRGTIGVKSVSGGGQRGVVDESIMEKVSAHEKKKKKLR